MSRIIQFEGRSIEVPDDATDDEVASILESTSTPVAQPAPAEPSFFEKLGSGMNQVRDFMTNLSAPKQESVLQGQAMPDPQLDPALNEQAMLRSRSPDSVMFTAGRGKQQADRMTAQGKKIQELAQKGGYSSVPEMFDAVKESESRKQFAKENPNIAAVGSGAANMLRGGINAPGAAAGFFNKTVVDPVLGALGAGPMPAVPVAPGSESLQGIASDYMPKVAKIPMGKAWDDGLFGQWLAANVSAQLPQMPGQILGAVNPVARAAVLPAMGGQAAGNSYADGDDPRVAVAKGVVEVLSEGASFGAADKIKDLLTALPAKAQKSLFTNIATKAAAAGGAVTGQMLAGAIEETVAQVGNNALDIYASGKNKSIGDGVADSAVVGAFASAGMSAPNVATAMQDNSPKAQAARELAALLRGGQFASTQAEQSAQTPSAEQLASAKGFLVPEAPKVEDQPTAPVVPAIGAAAVEKIQQREGASNEQKSVAQQIFAAEGEAQDKAPAAPDTAAEGAPAGAPVQPAAGTEPVPAADARPAKQSIALTDSATIEQSAQPAANAGEGAGASQPAQTYAQTSGPSATPTLSPQAQALQGRMRQAQNGAYGNTTAASGQLDPATQPSSAGAQPTDRGGRANPVAQAAGAADGQLATATKAGSGTPTGSVQLQLAPKADKDTILRNQMALKRQKGVVVQPVADDHPLTYEQKVVSHLAAKMGKTLTWVELSSGPDNEMPDGWINSFGGEHIFLDINSSKPLLEVLLHEGTHGLPSHIRVKLRAFVNSKVSPEGRAKFLAKYNYEKMDTSVGQDEEVLAYVAQQISRKPEFLSDLKTALGNKDFSAFVAHVLSKFKELMGGKGQSEFDSEFLGQHVKDVAEIHQRLVEAYTQAMQEQGLQPDQQLVGEEMAFAKKPADFNHPEERLSVSTAQPTAKPDRKTGYQPNSYDEKRVIDADDVLESKSHLETIGNALRKYNTLSGTGDSRALVKELHDVVVDNLLWLHDRVNPEVRERAKLWYDGANRIANEWKPIFSLSSDRQAGGILAVLSPQMDWFKNVSLAERALTILQRHGNETWSSGMTQWADSWLESSNTKAERESRAPQVEQMRRIAESGKTLSQLTPEDAAMFVRAFDEAYFPRSYRLVTPEGGFGDFVRNEGGKLADVTWGGFGSIAKAVRIYRDGSFRTVDRELGGKHKVRNFYNNIVDPNSADGHVTIDTHAVAAALLKSLSGNSEEVKHNLGGLGSTAPTGASGSYAIFADAYRDAAAKRGLLAREMQSITWEAVRSLFPANVKDSMAKGISEIHDRVKAGEITKEQARAEIDRQSRAAGGSKPFAWEGSGFGEFAKDGATSFDGEISPDPDERQVRVKEAKDARDKMQVSISASTTNIPWIGRLYKMAQRGNEIAHAQLQILAVDGLKDALKGVSASFQYDPVTGLYGGASEPSLAVTVSFKDKDRDVVLAALKQFADNFKQEQIHVRQATKDQIGTEYDDGSYVTPVYRWELNRALDRKEVQKVIDRSGLYGLTFGDGFVEAYYVGNPKDANSISQFQQGADRVRASIGQDGQGVTRRLARLWAYGDRGDGAIGWGRAGGDSAAGQETQLFANKSVDGAGASAQVDVTGGSEALPNAVSLTGIHFSQQVRNYLDGRYNGTGLKGAERNRLADAKDSRIKERVYFYVDEGNGIRPEAGVGGVAHAASLENLYNVTGDPQGLFKSRDDNANESALLDAGYSGYYVPKVFNNQGVAVVLGNSSRGIAVTPTGYEKGKAPEVAPTPYKRGLTSKELNAIDLNAVQAVAPSAKLRMGTLSMDQDDVPAARQELAKQGIDIPEAGPVFANKAQRSLDQDVVLEIPVEGGGTAKLTVNAQQYINQLDKREEALRMVKNCLA